MAQFCVLASEESPGYKRHKNPKIYMKKKKEKYIQTDGEYVEKNWKTNRFPAKPMWVLKVAPVRRHCLNSLLNKF
jgi:hypothetical protein